MWTAVVHTEPLDTCHVIRWHAAHASSTDMHELAAIHIIKSPDSLLTVGTYSALQMCQPQPSIM